MLTFSTIYCTVMKYVPPDPWHSIQKISSAGSAENVPSNTHVFLEQHPGQTGLTLSLTAFYLK